MDESAIEVGDASMVEETTEIDVEMTVTETNEVMDSKPDEAPNGAGVADDGVADDGDVQEVEGSATGHFTRRLTFIDYLKSPIVEILVGSNDEEPTLLTAHQGLLMKSPYFANMCAVFGADEVKRVELLDHHLDAVGCFLQYLYTGDYYPKLVEHSRYINEDGSEQATDDTGEQLLKHAKVYTLAEKLGMPKLQTLAHSKIHRINSTAKGEILYARYVYSHTSSEDRTIRKPIARFWSARSHVLRHEAEDEFRRMCLEFPEFGFDVLSMVLDAKEGKPMQPTKDHGRRSEHHHGGGGGGGERSARKRARTSAAG